MTDTQGIWFCICYVILLTVVVAFGVYILAPLQHRRFVRRYRKKHPDSTIYSDSDEILPWNNR